MSNRKPSSPTNGDPTGIYIDPPSNKWMIGQRLGSGACGSVHILTKKVKSNHIPSNYAIKVAPLPPLSNKSTSKKKKKNELEKNADLLYFENTLYRNVLNELRGSMIPDIPVAGYGSSVGNNNNNSSSSSSASETITNSIPPIGFGDLDSEGYRFLIMERMEFPFHSIAPFLLNDWINAKPSSMRKSCKSPSSSCIDIGAIAIRMIRLIQAIHETQRLFVDVKPENFMIAKAQSSATKKKQSTSHHQSSLTSSLAQRIRLIDFGLIETIKDATNNKHRQNSYPNGQMVGTPIYASLNVLNGHTVSRRDDLESVGYVIVELILQLMYCIDNLVSPKSKRSTTKKKMTNEIELNDVPMDLLPWCNTSVKSDDEIYRLKKNAMRNEQGELWTLLRPTIKTKTINTNDDQAICQLMKAYFDHVTTLEYKQKPDYDLLCDIVSKLRVHVDLSDGGIAATTRLTEASASMNEKPSRRKRSTITTTRRHITTRARAKEEQEEEEEFDFEQDNDEESDNEDDDEIIELAKKASANKRKTRTQRKVKDEIDGKSRLSNESTSNGGRKARKKRITKTTVTTTETIEIIETDEEHDNKSDDESFTEAKESIHYNHISEDEEMISAEDFEEDKEEVENHDPYADMSVKSCHSMDWEVLPNHENDVLVMDSGDKVLASSPQTGDQNVHQNAKLSARKDISLKLECIEGSHQGTTLTLTGELLIGQNPRRGNKQKKHMDTYEIENDDETSDVHAKLALNKSGSKRKPLLTVRVTDMKSHQGTFVNGKRVGASGKQAFVNDKIRIGQNVFCIKL